MQGEPGWEQGGLERVAHELADRGLELELANGRGTADQTPSRSRVTIRGPPETDDRGGPAAVLVGEENM